LNIASTLSVFIVIIQGLIDMIVVFTLAISLSTLGHRV
jgi:hypothetical protein